MVDYTADVKACVAALAAGETILYPTDTVWGLGCDATNEAAIEKIFRLKDRPAAKSLIVLIADARDVLQYVAAPPPDVIDIMASFKQPTTVVFDGALHLADNVLAEDGSVALRVPQDSFCRALIKRFGKPVVSTSANRSGMAAPQLFSEINAAIVAGASYAVQYRRDDMATRPASRIVRINDDGSLRILRP